MTCPMVIALAAEENRTLSVSTCCASSWLVTVNREVIRGAFSSCRYRAPDPSSTCSTGVSARIPANIG